MSAHTASPMTATLQKLTNKKPDTTSLNTEMCTTCNKKLPKLNENLIKDSLRMKSEIAQLSTQRKSLMDMLNRNDDLVYPLSGYDARSNTGASKSATSRLIDEERYNSVMNKYAEVLRNRGLHDCNKLHTNSRKHEYRKWDFPHLALAKYHQKPTANIVKWNYEEEDNSTDESSDEEIPVAEFKLMAGGANSSRITTTRAGDCTATRRMDQSQDDEEEIPEAERVRLTVDRIRKAKNGGMLTEIHQIKERHRQLEALTQTKKRALADADKPKSSRNITDGKLQKDTLNKYLLANANLQKELNFKTFKDKTTVKLNRKFNEKATEAIDPGIVWAPKWSVNTSHMPGKISKSTHPVSDANKRRAKPAYVPVRPGDLPPCVFLPKHIDGKTPVESAWLLDRFMKETLQAAKAEIEKDSYEQ